MNRKRPPVPVIVILILAVLIVGYFGIRSLQKKGSNALTASSTIEAVEVTISPEIGGKVAEVMVNEGTSVRTGDVLFRLDDTLLQAQRTVAAASLDLAGTSASMANAALATAQVNYNLALDAARLESAATRTLDWRAVNPAGYTLPGGYFNSADEITAAQTEVEATGSALDAAQHNINTLLADPANTNFVAAETRLINAHAAIVVAQDVLRSTNATNNTDLHVAAQSSYDTAKTELDDAQAAYDALKDTDPVKQIITARASLSAAQESHETAQDCLLSLQTGENSPKVAAAQAILHQAQAAVDQAHLAVTQAEDNLALLDVQIAKLMVKAPADGVILTRSIEPGEMIAPSASAMTLGRLTNLTITVYVPEDRYGELSLGQSATVTVNSFPGDVFTATVSHIADEAEFTPRNVQTVEGRSSTVFAIKLQVQDPTGKLKPGMPADVTFEPGSK